MFGAFLQQHVLVLLGYGAMVASFAALERWRPVDRQTAPSLFFNLALFSLIYLGLSGYYFGMTELRHYVVAMRHDRFGLPDLLDLRIDPIELAVRFLLFVLVADFIKYWMHRALHRVPFLWRFHRAHHSDRNLNTSTNLREQWLGTIYGDAVFMFAAVPLLGSLSASLPLTVAYAAYGFFAHSNLRLPLGRLTPLFVGPQYHRIHHSILPRHAHRNFASFFPLFDILFGTYFAPGRDEFPPTGLVGERHDSLWRIQMLPFQAATPPAWPDSDMPRREAA